MSKTYRDRRAGLYEDSSRAVRSMSRAVMDKQKREEKREAERELRREIEIDFKLRRM